VKQPFPFKLIPPRPDFPFTMSDPERATMLAHVSYWGELTAAGATIAYGPVDDPTGGYGIGVIVADDLAAAEALRDADPAVLSPHGFHTEILPMFRLVTPSATYDAVAG
jgi:uncharacterized protein YciI